MKVQLPEADGPPGTQLTDSRRVVLGNEIFIKQRAGRRSDSAREEYVLVRYRDSVKRTAIDSRCHLLVAVDSLLHRLLFCNGDERVKPVALFDLPQRIVY